MADLTVINNNNVINMRDRNVSGTESDENQSILAAIRALRGDDIQGVVVIGFKRDGTIDVNITDNCFANPADTVYAAEVLKNLIINNSEY